MAEGTRLYWKRDGAEPLLVVAFEGVLSGEQALLTASEMVQALRAEEAPRTLVWDCRSMTGYDMQARLIWQRVLKQSMDRITKIYLISNSRIVRAGATLIGAFAAVDIESVTDWDEVPLG